jgi:hypothetical protein
LAVSNWLLALARVLRAGLANSQQPTTNSQKPSLNFFPCLRTSPQPRIFNIPETLAFGVNGLVLAAKIAAFGHVMAEAGVNYIV